MSNGRNTADAPDYGYGRRTAPEASWPHVSRCQCQHCRAVGNVTADRPTGPATRHRITYEWACPNCGQYIQTSMIEDDARAAERARILAALPEALGKTYWPPDTWESPRRFGETNDRIDAFAAALAAAIEAILSREPGEELRREIVADTEATEWEPEQW